MASKVVKLPRAMSPSWMLSTIFIAFVLAALQLLTGFQVRLASFPSNPHPRRRSQCATTPLSSLSIRSLTPSPFLSFLHDFVARTSINRISVQSLMASKKANPHPL